MEENSERKYENLAAGMHEVLQKKVTKGLEITTVKGEKWYLLRILPYRTLRILPYRTVVNFIDGAVITVTNITNSNKLEKKLEKTRYLAESIVGAVRDPRVVLDEDLKVVSGSRTFGYAKCC